MRSVQDTYAPNNMCFGCGPSNQKGLMIKSMVEGDTLVALFSPQSHHQAFDNVLSGGICGTLLDCHSNWCAAYFIMKMRGGGYAPMHGDCSLCGRVIRTNTIRQGFKDHS